jgi:hypothetical protein
VAVVVVEVVVAVRRQPLAAVPEERERPVAPVRLQLQRLQLPAEHEAPHLRPLVPVVAAVAGVATASTTPCRASQSVRDASGEGARRS